MRKEEYFTQENIAREAARMAGDLPVNPRAAAFQPTMTALLVIDMQDYFLSPESHAFLPAAPAIVPVVNELTAAFTRAGRPVLFTRHGGDGREAGQMAAWWRELLTIGHPLGGIHSSLRLGGEPVIAKAHYDAFHRTDLEEILRRKGAGQLVISGVTTHLCCESTARSAFVRGFAVFMVIDGTATLNRDLHAASLRALAHGFAVPALASTLLAALARDS